ncbi:hypothetical protein ACFQ9J_04485 [Streptomyces sp. NPDC056529]|uniref:hypothetical protein n=1 Tax=Streptomyces sp. NPDC056529 TaxID=3345855 RepID=UPI003683E269
MATLTGCVSVGAPTAPAPVPAPAAEPVRTGKGVAPQIVDGPAREALEAALPAPPPSASPRATPAAERQRGSAAPALPQAPRPGVVPTRREDPRPPVRPDRPGPAVSTGPSAPTGPPRAVEPPVRPPLSPSDVCALGERYGALGPGGGRPGICPAPYGR